MPRSKDRVSADPSSLGNIARIYGLLDEKQLNKAVAWQRKCPGRKLGEVMVEMGLLSPEQVKYLLRKQEDVRTDAPKSRRDLRAYLRFAVHQLHHPSKIDDLCAAARKKPGDT